MQTKPWENHYCYLKGIHKECSIYTTHGPDTLYTTHYVLLGIARSCRSHWLSRCFWTVLLDCVKRTSIFWWNILHTEPNYGGKSSRIFELCAFVRQRDSAENSGTFFHHNLTLCSECFIRNYVSRVQKIHSKDQYCFTSRIPFLHPWRFTHKYTPLHCQKSSEVAFSALCW